MFHPGFSDDEPYSWSEAYYHADDGGISENMTDCFTPLKVSYCRRKYVPLPVYACACVCMRVCVCVFMVFFSCPLALQFDDDSIRDGMVAQHAGEQLSRPAVEK